MAVDQVPIVSPIRCDGALVCEVVALPVNTDLLWLPASSSLPKQLATAQSRIQRRLSILTCQKNAETENLNYLIASSHHSYLILIWSSTEGSIKPRPSPIKVGCACMVKNPSATRNTIRVIPILFSVQGQNDAFICTVRAAIFGLYVD